MIERVVSIGLAGAEVHLCLHRVVPSQSMESIEDDTLVTPEALDELLLLLLGAGEKSRVKRLVVSFDDGYADAVAYARSRYERFPTLEWMFFVCPAKTRDRIGFRWDTLDRELEQRQPLAIDLENRRSSLSAMGDEPAHRLATVDELRQLAALPRVTLGNHTNCHF